MPRPHDPDVVRITDARDSLTADVRSRQRKYLISMLVRTVAFLAAVLLLHGWARWVGVGLAVVLPWIAVLFANAGRPAVAPAPTRTAGAERRAVTDGGTDTARGPVTVAGNATTRTRPGPVPQGAITQRPDGGFQDGPSRDGGWPDGASPDAGSRGDGAGHRDRVDHTTVPATAPGPDGPVELTTSRRN